MGTGAANFTKLSVTSGVKMAPPQPAIEADAFTRSAPL